jgi:hypothetical protein
MGGFLYDSGWPETKIKMGIKNDMILIDIRTVYTVRVGYRWNRNDEQKRF